MKIAVLSDIHDNIWNLEKALAQLDGVEQLIFLGDFCAPFSLKQIAEAFNGPIHCVPGNNDGDMFLLLNIAMAAGNVTYYRPIGTLTAGGCAIAFTHYPEVAEGLVATGKYQAVFSGHTHQFMQTRVGNTLWVNPGEVMGRWGDPGFIIYDTETGLFERALIR